MKDRPARLVINPFVSEAQRAWMYAKHPKMAAKWQAHTPKGKLPRHKKKRKRRRPVHNSRPVGRVDPTRTLTLRRAMSTRIKRAFRLLKGRIVQLILGDDALGLGPVRNVFCPTGAGGGVDPSCAPGQLAGVAGTTIHLKELRSADDGKDIHVSVPTDRAVNIPGHGEVRSAGPVALADARREAGQVTLLKVHADEELRGVGLPRRLIAEVAKTALAEGLPLRTTGVFSESGRRMMDKLVRDGYADKLPGGDYEVRRDRITADYVTNAFCPTGAGGGVDPSCSPGQSGGAGKKWAAHWPAEVNVSGSGDGTITDKDGNAYQVHHEVRTNDEGEHKHVYTVTRPGGTAGVNTVAGAETGWNKNRIMSVMTHSPHQRKGIASALYDHIERHLGTKLHENPATTPDGEAFWRHRARTGRGVPAVNSFCPTGEGGGVDPSCSPGGAGGSVTMFHGTTASALESVMKSGLTPGGGKGSDHVAKLGGVDYSLTYADVAGRSVSVFVSDSADKASVYAAKVAAFHKSQPLVLKVVVPASMLREDEAGGSRSSFRFEGTIKPEWIKEAFSVDYENDRLVSRGHPGRLVGNEPSVTAWLVLLTDEGVTANAFCPTGAGGGVDPTCSPGGGSAGGGEHSTVEGGPPQGLIDRLKAAGAKVGHAEHVAKEYVRDRIAAAVSKLPRPLQSAVNGAYFVLRMGTATAFSGWTASQAFAERIARERGASEEESRRLRGVLSSLDLAAFKPLSVALSASGVGHAVMGATWVVPPVTAGYLAYSTARDPLATARAATGLVRDALGKAGAFGRRLLPARPRGTRPRAGYKPEVLELARNSERSAAGLVAAALEAHAYDDWYIALLSAACDESGDVGKAVGVADGLFFDTYPARSKGLVGNAGQWQFLSSPQKLGAFTRWIRAQSADVLLDRSSEAAWQKYVQDGYRKGQGRAYDDVKGVVAGAESSREGFLRTQLGAPVAVEKARLLASRTFTDLENVTADMSAKMSRALTDGLVQGKGPREIASDLTDQVDLSETRALTIARTEIVRAHAEGQLDALEALGVAEVGVMVEWQTTPDGKVCPECEPMDGVVLSLDEARGLIPRHPNCRCAFIPANVGEDEEGQKRTQKAIDAAAKDSADAGGDDFDLEINARPPGIRNWAGDTALYSPQGKGREDLRRLSRRLLSDNTFCATGPGGGVDPSCSPGDRLASVASVPKGEGHFTDDSDQVRMKDLGFAGAGSVYGLPEESKLAKLLTTSKVPASKIRYTQTTVKRDAVLAKMGGTDARAEEFSATGRPLAVKDGDQYHLQNGHHRAAAQALQTGEVEMDVVEVEYRNPKTGKVDWKKPPKAPKVPKATANAFCPTGLGGGVDPSCSPGGSTGATGSDAEGHDSEAAADHADVKGRAERMANAPHDYSAEDVDAENAELIRDGSDYQVVPDGKGGFEAMTRAEADALHGENWAVFDDPETGYPNAGPRDYEEELYKTWAEDPDEFERAVADGMNRRLDRLRPEEVEHVNEQMDRLGGEFRLGADGRGQVFLYGVDDLQDDYPGGFRLERTKAGKLKMVANAFDPEQPRDPSGKWTSGGGAGGSDAPDSLPAGLSIPKRLADVFTEEESSQYRKLASERGKLLNEIRHGRATDTHRSRVKELGEQLDRMVATGDERLKAGGGKAETVKAEKPPESEGPLTIAEGYIDRDRLTAYINQGAFAHERDALAATALILRGKPAGPIKIHGMKEAEEMHSFEAGDIRFYYPNTEHGVRMAADTLRSITTDADEPIPDRLWSANKNVVFSTQRNKDDKYWEQQYGMPGFRSAATGGDPTQSICVYDASMSRGTFVHEAGHNLARQIWDDTYPHWDSDYGRAQDAEPAVSDYGEKSRAEDFAEAARLFTSSRFKDRQRLHELWPKKYAAMYRIVHGKHTVPKPPTQFRTS